MQLACTKYGTQPIKPQSKMMHLILLPIKISVMEKLKWLLLMESANWLLKEYFQADLKELLKDLALLLSILKKNIKMDIILKLTFMLMENIFMLELPSNLLFKKPIKSQMAESKLLLTVKNVFKEKIENIKLQRKKKKLNFF
jgi:hypothetical protein